LGLRGGGAELGEEGFGVVGLESEGFTGLGSDLHDRAVAPFAVFLVRSDGSDLVDREAPPLEEKDVFG
jgi:hypothetical protein